MVKRHHQIDFAAGALVFPGGKSHAGDHDPAWADHATGWESVEADGAPLRIAAIREAFEEAGVLLARDAAGDIYVGEGGDRRAGGGGRGPRAVPGRGPRTGPEAGPGGPDRLRPLDHAATDGQAASTPGSTWPTRPWPSWPSATATRRSTPNGSRRPRPGAGGGRPAQGDLPHADEPAATGGERQTRRRPSRRRGPGRWSPSSPGSTGRRCGSSPMRATGRWRSLWRRFRRATKNRRFDFRLCGAGERTVAFWPKAGVQRGASTSGVCPRPTTQGRAWTSANDQTVGTVPPSMTNSAPWIAAARSEARKAIGRRLRRVRRRDRWQMPPRPSRTSWRASSSVPPLAACDTLQKHDRSPRS